MQLSITSNGTLVRKGLADLSAELPKVPRQPLRACMERIRRRMQEYPPEPAGQSVTESHPVLGKIYRPARGRYQRTGLLGSRWAIEERGQGYTISNTAARRGREYGIYVVGDAYGNRQAWMHQGRWQVFRDVAEDEIAKLPPEMEKALHMVTRRAGL